MEPTVMIQFTADELDMLWSGLGALVFAHYKTGRTLSVAERDELRRLQTLRARVYDNLQSARQEEARMEHLRQELRQELRAQILRDTKES